MGDQRRVISYEDVVHAASSRFVDTSTVDLNALAADLAVSRATLYRVIPGRDRVLGDVVWGFGAEHHERARSAVPGSGAARVVGVLRRFGDIILDQRSFRGFLDGEPDVAARVLFTQSGAVHERFVAANRALLEESVDPDGELPFEADTTAYVLSRLYESMWYADLLSGRTPDLDVADRAALAILEAG